MFYIFISFLLAFLIAPLVIKIYQKNNWLDDPEKDRHAKKTHQKAVPRGGGLVIFLAILLSSLIFLEFDKYLIFIMLGAFLLTLIGFLDDIYNLHPNIRLITGLIAALLVVGSGIGIAYISNPFSPEAIHLDQPQIPLFLFGKTRTIWVLSDFFAVIFILWNMNIINWSKGVDGQLPSFVAVAFFFIALVSLQFFDDPAEFNTTILSFIACGAYLGLLYWNWYPQKIMPGYGAGSLAGYFLSVLAILSGAKLATTLLVLSIPTADGIFTIVRRLLAGKSPIWGDRGHLHHKLLDQLGWGKRRISLFYAGYSMFMGLLSLLLNTQGKLIMIILTIILIFLLQINFKLGKK